MNHIFKKHRTGWKSWIIIGSGFIFMVCGKVLSDEVGRGGYAGSFLRMGLGARALAMGGGSAALADDGYTTYYNPAGLVYLDHRWVTATLNSMALDRRLFYLGYAQSIGGKDKESRKKGLLQGGFSVGWVAAGVDQIDARDFSGNDIGSFSNWEHCFYFSFAMNPAPPFSIGVSGKLLYNRFPDLTDEGDALTAVGFGFDIGFIFKPTRFITLGLTVRDLRSKYTWDTQNLYERGTQTIDSFPKILQGGVVYKALSDRLTFALDLEKVEYWPVQYIAGVQVEAYRGIFLRGGIRHNEPTFGFGYSLKVAGKSVQLDYGFIPDPVAPRSNHVFSWSFVF